MHEHDDVDYEQFPLPAGVSAYHIKWLEVTNATEKNRLKTTSLGQKSYIFAEKSRILACILTCVRQGLRGDEISKMGPCFDFPQNGP